jgi:hypothetical protein
MPVKRRLGDRGLEFFLQELIERVIGAKGLILLENNRFFDHGPGRSPRPAAIVARPADQAFESLLAVLLPFPPERGPGGLPPRPVREIMLGFRELAQKGSRLLLRNHSREERAEQRTPEHGPLLMPILPTGHPSAPCSW